MNRPAAPDQRRAAWLRVLARASAAELDACAAPVLADYRFENLRGPECGLTMVRARIGNRGDRFNLGEATVSRCVVRHCTADGRTTIGVGYVQGRSGRHAECIAQLDALLQLEALHPLLMTTVIEPLRAAREQRDAQARAATETSRVRFYTLQPETAP